MRILGSGDHHFHAAGPRWTECLRIHEWMVDEARRRGVDLFVSAGDIYEKASTPDERMEVARWVVSMAEVCPVVIVRGNHDAVRDLRILARLKTLHPVYVIEDAEVLEIGDALVGGIAWPSTASIAAQAEAVGVAAPDVAEDAMAAVCRGIGGIFDERDPERVRARILVAHAMVDGSVTSHGQPLIGAEMHVGLSTLELAGADYTVLGHIHKPQEWEIGGRHIFYTGSPFRTAFGELEQKSVTLIDTSARTLERVPTPSTPMVLLETTWGDGAFAPIDNTDVAGAEVRFRYTVDAEQAPAARRAAAEMLETLTARGAVSVKVDAITRPKVRARAPEVATAPSLVDKLKVLWASRQRVPDAATQERLLAKLASIS